MSRIGFFLSTLLALAVSTPQVRAGEKVPLRVLYLARDSDQGRTEAFKSLLGSSFVESRAVNRSEFKKSDAEGIDVVLLDWSQAEARSQKNYPSPLGERAAWSIPTVLLGSAGHIIAGPWEVIGGSGCTCLSPFVYELGEHAIARGPLLVDMTQQVEVDNPWRYEFDEPTVKVLALVLNGSERERDGWCTYAYEHKQAPELEIICGGINAKTAKASGIWRQGHLLHFGFEESPADMNPNGRALLVNAICYISRFTEDRPIIRAPSPFYSDVRIVDRDIIPRALSRPSLDLRNYLGHFLAKDVFSHVEDLDREAIGAWFKEVRPYVCANADGKLAVDRTAQELNLAPNEIGFFDTAISALSGDDDRARKIRDLLAKYAPDGPEPKVAAADEWRRWLVENRDYLFFSDTGGYRWYIDPLAKKRHVLSRDLRGPARASRPG